MNRVLYNDDSIADKLTNTTDLASSDHLAGAKSIIVGMGRGKKGHLIHISGTGVLNDASTGFGNPTTKVYDDVRDIEEITSLPLTALHRDVDDAVITTGKQLGVPTAIICPPLIHGLGTGPLKKRSIQIPYLTEAIVQRGTGFTVGDGNNLWDRKCRRREAVREMTTNFQSR